MTLYDETQLRKYAYNQIQLSSFLDQIAVRVRSIEAQLAHQSELSRAGQDADSVARAKSAGPAGGHWD